MKRLSIILGLAAAFVCAESCQCSGSKEAGEDDGEAAVAEEVTDADTLAQPQLPDEPIYDIVTSMGTIKVKLYSKTPQHKANFMKLADSHYYNGTLFHRVIDGFMIQAGDPLTKDPSKADQWGTGGPDYTVPAEIINEYYHKKGALAAARTGDAANPKRASSGSQFYLVQDEDACLHLDGAYSIFGETVEGLDVIDKIAAVPTDNMDRPLKNVTIYRITLDPECLVVPDSTDE